MLTSCTASCRNPTRLGTSLEEITRYVSEFQALPLSEAVVLALHSLTPNHSPIPTTYVGSPDDLPIDPKLVVRALRELHPTAGTSRLLSSACTPLVCLYPSRLPCTPLVCLYPSRLPVPLSPACTPLVLPHQSLVRTSHGDEALAVISGP